MDNLGQHLLIIIVFSFHYFILIIIVGGGYIHQYWLYVCKSKRLYVAIQIVYITVVFQAGRGNMSVDSSF